VYLEGSISPDWNIDQIKSLNYKFDYHKDIKLIEQYKQVGHYEPSMHLYNCFENKLSINLDSIRKEFSFLTNLSIAINLFTPGQYLPLHRDLYGRYQEIHKLDNNVNIARIILFVENNSLGQILQIENKAIATWNAGDWFGWTNDDLHAFYNFSFENRYAFQITGTLI